MTPGNMASVVGVRSELADAARKLRPHAMGKDKYVVDGWSRDEGERIPASVLRLLDVALNTPSLTDALAVVHAMERVIVRHHTATHRLCLTTAIVDDADADNIGNSALARYATDKSPSAIEALVEAAYAEKVSAMVLAAAGEVTHARLTSGRPLSLAR